MSGAVTFVCDRCGALGRAAAAGRARCGACGRIVVVEAPFPPAVRAATPLRPTPANIAPPAKAAPRAKTAPPVQAAPSADAAAENARGPADARLPPLAPPSGPGRFERSEISPEDLPPPEGGYVDLVLDDDAPPAAPPPAAVPATETAPPPLPAPRADGTDVSTRPTPRPSTAQRQAAVPPPLPPAVALAHARKIPRVVAAAVLFGAGAALAAGVTVAARAVLRDPAERSAPAIAPAPVAAAPAAEPPTRAEPTPGLAVALADEPPPAPAPAVAAPRRQVNRRAAEVTISTRRLVPTPRPLAGAPAPQAEPEAATHGLTAPTPIELAPPPAPPAVEDAPAYPGDGFRKPVAADRGCVERALRLPRDLAGRFDGTLTAKFAVAADGTVGRVEVLGPVPDARVPQAVESAIRACRFLPGADAQGKPTALWAVMPLRFVTR